MGSSVLGPPISGAKDDPGGSTKLNHFASLLDFSCKFNDPGFDNGPLIQAGLDQAGTLLIPTGQKSDGTAVSLTVATPVVMKSGMRLGSEQQHDRWRSAANGGAMPVLNYVGTGAAFKVISTDIASACDSISLEGLTVDGRGCTGAVDGLLLDAAASGAFIEGFGAHRVTFRNFPRHQVNIRGVVFDFRFTECTFLNPDRAVTDDLVRVEFVSPFPASSHNYFYDCFAAIYTTGFWCYRLETSGAYFNGGVVALGVAGGNGIFAKFGLDVSGLHLEGADPSDLTSVGIRVSGENGGVIAPMNCSVFGTGVQIGDPDNPSDAATGFQVQGNVGFNNVAAGGKDIHIVGGGRREGTTINMGNTPSGQATIIDDRDATLNVSGATNAAPIEITTSANHPYVTGDQIFQYTVGGNNAANGLFTITKTAANKYTLAGSVGSGAYTTGGHARIYRPDVQLQVNGNATQVVEPQIRGRVTQNLSNPELSYNLGADRNDGIRIRSRQNTLKLAAQLLNNGGDVGELDLYDNAEVQGVLLRALSNSQLRYPLTIGDMVSPSVLLEMYATKTGTFGARLTDKDTGLLTGQWLVVTNGGEFSLYDASSHQTVSLSGGGSLRFVVKDTSGNIICQIDSAGAIFPQSTSAGLYGCSGNPEGVLTASAGSFSQSPGGDGPYYKQSGSGNTGWVSLATGTNFWISVTGGIRTNNQVGINTDPTVDLEVNGNSKIHGATDLVGTVTNDTLTPNQPVVANGTKQLSSQKIDLGNSNLIDISGFATGYIPQSTGTAFSAFDFVAYGNAVEARLQALENWRLTGETAAIDTGATPNLTVTEGLVIAHS